ncbi:MAG: hypothetical protein ACOC33_00690 [bacterium]
MNIQEYYENYIQNYYPYENSLVYKSLSKIICNDYFDDLYNKTPVELKQLFEKNEIPQSLYDVLLISIGLSENIVMNLTFWEKTIFLDQLSDYQKSKGSVDLLKKILLVYENIISAYELYITYENNMWVFKPKTIYNNPLNTELTQNLSFYDIYQKTPNFFLNDQYLDREYQSNNILLPIKSNLLLIDFMDTDTSFILDDLIISSFMNTYKDNLFTISFDEQVFELNISLITYMWFYLVCEYFEYNWGVFPNNLVLHYNSNNAIFPSIQEVENIIELYNNINIDSKNSRKNIDDLYNEYFMTPFSEEREIENNITLDVMYTFIYNRNIDLALFLKKQFESNDKAFIIRHLLSSLYYTLFRVINGSDDEIFKKYGIKWLLYLPKLIINVEQTPEYKLINEFKPKHTEIVQSQFSGISIDNKFNSVLMDISIDIELDCGPYTSSIVMSDNIEFEEE